MKLIENMTAEELQLEIDNQTSILNKALLKIDEIHGHKDYSDEIAKQFHLGMVGYRKDTKRVNRTIDKVVKNGTEAVEQYNLRDNAQSRIDCCKKALEYINSNNGNTVRSIKNQKMKDALSNAPVLQWQKIQSVYGGTAYQHGEYVVDKVSDGFVAVRFNGELVTHKKTIKDAKATVSLLLNSPGKRERF